MNTFEIRRNTAKGSKHKYCVYDKKTATVPFSGPDKDACQQFIATRERLFWLVAQAKWRVEQ